MVSLDVESLFSNTSLLETFDIITDIVCDNSDRSFGFDRTSFTDLLSLAVSDPYSLFNNNIYQQVDVAGVLTNIPPQST